MSPQLRLAFELLGRATNALEQASFAMTKYLETGGSDLQEITKMASGMHRMHERAVKACNDVQRAAGIETALNA